jgi:hypothetical protein
MFKFIRRDRRRRHPIVMLEAVEARQLLSIVPAIVTAPGIVISGSGSVGVIKETRGVPFTVRLGTFFTLLPGDNLQAFISWGDGIKSQGTIKPLPTVGPGTAGYEVDGSHTYTSAGTFAIHVNVIKPGPTPTSPVVLVTTLDDTAIVARGNVNLTGKISGKYVAVPTAADLGALYQLTGVGSAGEMGPVAAKGSLSLPGFVTTGRATGTLTLSSISTTPLAGGTVTLKLTGPLEPGFGPVPATMTYTVTGGTGQFTGATGAGTVGVVLNSDGTFVLTIISIKPTV